MHRSDVVLAEALNPRKQNLGIFRAVKTAVAFVEYLDNCYLFLVLISSVSTSGTKIDEESNETKISIVIEAKSTENLTQTLSSNGNQTVIQIIKNKTVPIFIYIRL